MAIKSPIQTKQKELSLDLEVWTNLSRKYDLTETKLLERKLA